ncbi:MAG: hypothetical protein ACLUDU_11740 [Butyricimonas faecihominis]
MRTLADLPRKLVKIRYFRIANVAENSDVLADLGFDSTTIMAMFIPTYQIYWVPALDLLKRMKKNTIVWNEDRMAKASAIGPPEE